MIEIIGIGAVIGICILYLVPVLLAYDRKHKDVASIGVVNVLLGWTIIGWVVALAWALKSKP